MDDRTEQTELLRRQAERLGLLAGLARPVQHELNNLLTVVFANLDMLARRVTEEAPRRQIGRVQEAARRFEASTRAILSLTRRPVPGEATLSPSAAIAALEPLLSVLLPAPGALAVELPAEAPACRFDQALLDSALVALARASAGKGSLAIAVTVQPRQVALRIGLPEAAESAEPAALLAALAAGAGGGFEAMPGSLRLILPVVTEGAA